MPRPLLLLVAVLLALGVSAPGAHAQPGREAAEAETEGRFVRALTAAWLGDHEEAVDLLLVVLQARPAEPAVHAALSASYDALGRLPEALHYAAQAVERGRDEPAYYAALADLQQRAGQPEAALATWAAYLALRPRDGAALSALADLQQRAGRFAEAAATWERYVEAEGDTPAALLRLEALYRRLGDGHRALAALTRAADASDDFALRYRLGVALRDAARPADAEAAFERVLAQAPAHREAALALAELLEARGEVERAAALRRGSPLTGESSEERLRRAAALHAEADEDPEAAREARALLEALVAEASPAPEALRLLGDLLYREGAYADAARHLDRALAADPRHLDAWTQAVSAHLRAGEPEVAARTADEARVLFPGQLALLKVAGYAYLKGERFDDAVATFDEALRVLADDRPDDTAARSHLLTLVALAHYEREDFAASDVAYAEALGANPDNALALNNFAYSLAERGARLDDALGMARRAVAAEPGSAPFLDTLGWVLFRLGRYAEAADALRQAVAADDSYALLFEHLGEAEAALGNAAAARAAWQRALDLDPENARLRDRLAGR